MCIVVDADRHRRPHPAPCHAPFRRLYTPHQHATAPFDARDLRNALGTFATGVAIITTRDPQARLYGLTANSFSSVSLDPPLVLWSLACSAPSLPAFRAATHFGVNVLTTKQQALSVRFAQRADDKFDGVSHEVGAYGVPLIDGAAAHFECRIVDRYYGGDHEIFLGHVERYSYERKPTLLFCHGTYCEARPLESDGAAKGPA